MLSTTPPAPDPDAVGRRRAVALAGHLGDVTTVRTGLDDPVGAVRATALGALARLGQLDLGSWHRAAGDAAPEVRRRAAELAPIVGADAVDTLIRLLDDRDEGAAEAACFGLGELGPTAVAAVPALSGVAGDHTDALVREAAVAALGAIGAPGGLAAILRATTDKPAVRRRAVLALAPYDGPEVDAALQRALTDRDWQVRQAAEDLGATPP